MASISTEPHGHASEVLWEIILAELDTDRLQLDRYMDFLKRYAELIGVKDDLRYVSVGIDARSSVESKTPRPFVESDLETVLLIEGNFPSSFSKRETRKALEQWKEEMSWIVDYNMKVSRTAVIQHIGGPNDLVTTQVLNLINISDRVSVRMVVTCAPINSP